MLFFPCSFRNLYACNLREAVSCGEVLGGMFFRGIIVSVRDSGENINPKKSGVGQLAGHVACISSAVAVIVLSASVIHRVMETNKNNKRGEAIKTNKDEQMKLGNSQLSYCSECDCL